MSGGRLGAEGGGRPRGGARAAGNEEDRGARDAPGGEEPRGEEHRGDLEVRPADALRSVAAARPAGAPRPADEARRALRAARKALAERREAERAARRAGTRDSDAATGPAREPAPPPEPRTEPAPGPDPEPATPEALSAPEPQGVRESPAVGTAATGTPGTAGTAGTARTSEPAGTSGAGDAGATAEADATAKPGDTADATGTARTRKTAPTAEAGETNQAGGTAGPHNTAGPHGTARTRGVGGSGRSGRGGGADHAGLAATWWGRAWVAALEEGALDVPRLVRGRAYAERGQVAAVHVEPGRLLAYVQGSRVRPYRAQVRLRTLSDDEWDRFLEAAAERPEHVAALLDKDLPHALADRGIPLLPTAGDLLLHCTCPDAGRPCKHAAALCYRAARLLDDDPFVLLLLRGRNERDIIDMLSRRHAIRTARDARATAATAPFPGVPAADVLAGPAPSPPPPPLPAPARPEPPPVYPAVHGGPDPLALDQLATEAAARAHALLTTGRDPVAELTVWQDAVRLAAARPGSGLTAATRGLYATLADATGRTPAELARAVAAWRQGGAEGLAVLEEPWDPPAGRFDRARPLLLAAELPVFRPWHNHLTHPRGHLQLRFGRDGLWYGYESEPGRDDWWPRGVPDLDPVGALTGLDTDVNADADPETGLSAGIGTGTDTSPGTDIDIGPDTR